MKKLIVNADDFGQSKGINNGIIEAHEQGIVTSASLMVRYPTAAEAAEYAKKNPSLNIGLHVDLGEWMLDGDEWKPVYKVVEFEDTGEIKKEIQGQLTSFYKLMHKKPTHIDSHQHVHLKDNVLSLFVEIAKELDIPLRRVSEKVKYCGDFYGQNEGGSTLNEAISVTALQNIISHLNDGITELACHPAKQIDLRTMYTRERISEVKTLCDPAIRETIFNSGVELISFGNLSF